jgi:hypothetical protein
MTTPKDTWISVKDAMPKAFDNSLYQLLVSEPDSTGFYRIISLSFGTWKRIHLTFSDLSFWMLLSKPKTK